MIAFSRGWLFAIAMLGMFPALGISGALFAQVMASGTAGSLKAYAQSAGYAEQALSAIRVVAANGQERTEIRLYNKFLDRVKESSMKNHFKGAVSFSLVWFSMYSAYSYALYVGSWFIENEIKNALFDRVYNSGDILLIFFGIMFGLFTVGALEPSFKAILLAKVAGKFTYETIDRVPQIPIKNPSGNQCKNLVGKIELKNVQFYYPSKPDQTILNEFNITFE